MIFYVYQAYMSGTAVTQYKRSKSLQEYSQYPDARPSMTMFSSNNVQLNSHRKDRVTWILADRRRNGVYFRTFRHNTPGRITRVIALRSNVSGRRYRPGEGRQCG